MQNHSVFRSIIILLSGVALMLVAGCSSGEPAAEPKTLSEVWEVIIDTAPEVSGIDSSEPEQPIVLGFSQLGSESDWRRANSASIQEAAVEAGIELRFANADQSQAKQVEAIRAFIREQVDVIALAPVIETGWEPVLMEAKLAGIPVIVTDRKADVEDESLYVTFIGSDFYDEGQKAAKYMLDKLSDRPGPVGIVELRGTEGSTPSIDRGRGFHDEMKQRGDLKVLSSEAADFTLEKGREVMRGFLEEHGSAIQVLFAHNDDMALGAIEAIEAYGLRPGKDIIIISVDGTRKAFEMMALGKINCVVECNPLLGPILMQAVKETMEGRTLPKHIVTPESVYTETTAAQEAPNRKY